LGWFHGVSTYSNLDERDLMKVINEFRCEVWEILDFE
jgi:hypothetical protein